MGKLSIVFLFLLLSVPVVSAGSSCCVPSSIYIANDTSVFLWLNGTRPMQGNLSMHGFAINNVRNVSDPSDATNVSWVQNLVWNNGTIVTDTDLLAYYKRDTSNTLTGANIRRDVNDETLSLYGGDSTNPQGGHIQLYGGDNVAMDGGMAFRVGDAAGVGTSVMWIEGRTDTPFLSMVNHQIKDLLDPTAAQDAVTVAYLTAHPSAPTAVQLNDYYKNDTSKLLFGSDLKREVDNSYLAMYGGNAIAGGTGIIVAFGKNFGAHEEVAQIIGGDATGVGNTVITGWMDGAAPYMNMYGYNITGIKTITNATDAVNLSFVNSITANVSAGGSGGQIIYFNHSASPDVAGFETLNLIPSGNAEEDESVVVNSGLGEVIVDPYVTSLLYPAITSIPPGLWRFRTFHYVSNSGGNTNAVFKVYKRSAAGAETLLFTVVSEDINANTVQEYLTSYAQASAIPLLTTDRLEIKVYGQSTSVSDKTFHFVYDGNIHTSHVLTPISVLSSLDNYAYLPGRSGGQTFSGEGIDGRIFSGSLIPSSGAAYTRFLVGEDISNHAHYGFGDISVINNKTTPITIVGHASYYAGANVTGLNKTNHQHSFQDSQVFSGSDKLQQQVSFYSSPNDISGEVYDLKQFYALTPDGIGTITNAYGFYAVGSNTRATNNYAFYSQMGAKSVFNGSMEVGREATPPVTFEVGGDNAHIRIDRNTYGSGLSFATSGSIKAYLYGELDGGGALAFLNSSAIEKMRLTNGGNLSLGAGVSPTAQLDTTGQVRFRNYGTGTANFDSAGNLYSISDEKYKTDIKPFTSGLSQILKINPIDYHFSTSSGLDTTNTYTGFSAQNLQTAIPEAVYEKPDIKYEQVIKTKGTLDEKTGVQTEDEYEQVEVPVIGKDGKQTTTLSISDRAIIAAQINAIKELNAKIEAQNATIAKQEARIAALEKKVGI